MKSYIPIFCILALSICCFARVGGPDLYGYTFMDSDEPGVAFSWLDIHDASEVPFSPVADDEAEIIHLPFTFRFYGTAYESLWVSTNGLISFFESYVTTYTNSTIPNLSGPNAFIAPLWDDQKLYSTDTIDVGVYYKFGGTAPARFCCISWVIFHYGYTEDIWTYQLILHEAPAGDGKIVFQYLDVVLEGDIFYSSGVSATVGIENASGTIGLQYSFNEAMLRDSLRIEFIPPVPVEHDMAAFDVVGIESPVINILEYSPRCIVRNFGSSDETGIIGRLVIAGNTCGEIYNEDVTFSIPALRTDTLEFPEWGGFPADTYTVTFSVYMTEDEYRSNDTFSLRTIGLEHSGFSGPDLAGYMWFDNFFDGPVAPAFQPISTIGATELPLSGDDAYLGIRLPFSFPFYGDLFDSVWISTNGFISFSRLTSSFPTNVDLPTSSPAGLIAAFWDDIFIRSTATPQSKIYTKSESVGDEQRFHIIYQNAYVPYTSTTNYLTFEIILEDSGEIFLQYAGLHPGDYPRILSGQSATIGISSPDGLVGLKYEFMGYPPENIVFDTLAIRFIPPSAMADTFPPNIVFMPESIYYVCVEDSTIHITVRITDPSDIVADTLYYSVGALDFFATAEIIEGNAYSYRIRLPGGAEHLEYYFVARDEFSNRAILPHGAPDSVFAAWVGNPHYHEAYPPYFEVGDNFSTWVNRPDFEWIELDPAEGGSGTLVSSFIGDDWISAPVYIGAEVWDEWGSWWSRHIRICSNGWITFDTTYTGSDIYFMIPHPEPPNEVIAAFMVDLTPFPPSPGLPEGRIFYWYVPERRFIVEWKNFYLYGDDSCEPITFEIIAYYAWDAGIFVDIQYLSVTESARALATIGIEEELYAEPYDGDTIGVLYMFHGQPSACIPTDYSVVRFFGNRTSISEKIPSEIRIGAVYPNPFNAGVEIDIFVPYPEHMRADIITMDGRKTGTIFDGEMPQGKNKLFWQPNENTVSGIYLLRISTSKRNYLRRLVLIK